jgi:VanZ family protein
MGLIFLLSAQPDFRVVPEKWQAEPISLAAHAFEYGVLALLLYAAARATPGLARHAWQAAFLLTLMYAASDELHQMFVPGRVADWRDIAADAVGAVLALGLARCYLWRPVGDKKS